MVISMKNKAKKIFLTLSLFIFMAAESKDCQTESQSDACLSNKEQSSCEEAGCAWNSVLAGNGEFVAICLAQSALVKAPNVNEMSEKQLKAVQEIYDHWIGKDGRGAGKKNKYAEQEGYGYTGKTSKSSAGGYYQQETHYNPYGGSYYQPNKEGYPTNKEQPAPYGYGQYSPKTYNFAR